jgi:hypothetical protein
MNSYDLQNIGQLYINSGARFSRKSDNSLLINFPLPGDYQYEIPKDGVMDQDNHLTTKEHVDDLKKGLYDGSSVIPQNTQALYSGDLEFGNINNADGYLRLTNNSSTDNSILASFSSVSLSSRVNSLLINQSEAKFNIANNNGFRINRQTSIPTIYVSGSSGNVHMYSLESKAGTSYIHYDSGTGELTYSAGTPSDIRWKSNIEKTDRGLSEVSQMRVVDYNFQKRKKRETGLIAQELEKILPEAIWEDKKGYKSIKYENVIPVLISSIQELNEKIKELENQNK